MGILHPWSRDGISVGMGAGQPKTPRRTPVSITSVFKGAGPVERVCKMSSTQLYHVESILRGVRGQASPC